MFFSTVDINARTKPGGIGFLQRLWQRIKRDTEPESVFILAKWSYEVYADIGVTSQSTKQFVTVVDTGAASGFIKRKGLPLRVGEKIPPLNEDVDVRKRSGKPVLVCSTNNLLVKIGKSTDRVCFYVVENLAVAVILGWDFCDRYVDAIRLRWMIVRLDDSATIPIVRKPSSDNSTLPLSKE